MVITSACISGEGRRDLLRAARAALGLDDLVLAIHDASFPADPDEDVGRGSPYGAGARRLCAFADRLGFNGLQLGPQGITMPANRSPYDGTAWSRDPRSISLIDWAADPNWEAIVDGTRVNALRTCLPPDTGRVRYELADSIHQQTLSAALDAFRKRGSPELRGRLAAFGQANVAWLDHDVAFEKLAAACGTDDPERWPVGADPGPLGPRIAEQFILAQCVVHAQHARFRDWLHARSWALWGDLQVGLSHRDYFDRESLFIAGYRMGAPPSRTDPLGQPWGYPVLRPSLPEADAFFRRRVRKMAGEYDGLRIDHPHGLVCPWVYRPSADDALRAVQCGARLFESPDLPDHLELAAFAVAHPSDLDRGVPRYDDYWVRSLSPAQLTRYAHRVGILMDELAGEGGRVACEVLSTAPYPLREVMRLYGLGRFRVTQKADLNDPMDGYRSEHAEARDWIMVGTHDTAPLSCVVGDWAANGTLEARARYLGERLVQDPSERARRVVEWTADRSGFLTAMFADALASPARHVVVFMSDLFGIAERYNRPGVVSDDNWSLRLPSNFEDLYRTNRAGSNARALDVPRAMALALRVSGRTDAAEIATRLESLEPC